MRRLLAGLAFAIAAIGAAPGLAQESAPTVAADLDPRRLELARQIVDIAFPPEGRREMLLRAGDTMAAQARTALSSNAGPAFDAGMEQILQRFFDRSRSMTERAVDEHEAALFEAIARGYARQFTAAELTEIRAFVATPTGAKYVRRSPELLSDPDVARANSAYMATVFAGLQPLQAELRRELTEYLAKRPETKPQAR